jgi:hypothetical protein
MTQKMMADLYGVTVSAINQHLSTFSADSEIDIATIKQYLIVQKEGDRQINRSIDHYNLQAIISIGFKIENQKAVQFRKWARQIVKEFTIKGFAMDDERLKNGGTVLMKQFFEELLTRIREIVFMNESFIRKLQTSTQQLLLLGQRRVKL